MVTDCPRSKELERELAETQEDLTHMSDCYLKMISTQGELAAYKKAKAENDERFLRERDAANKRAEAAEAEIALWKRQYENLEDNVIEVARNWPRGGARGQQVTAYDMLLEVARRHKYKTSDERQALAEPEGKPHE